MLIVGYCSCGAFLAAGPGGGCRGDRCLVTHCKRYYENDEKLWRMNLKWKMSSVDAVGHQSDFSLVRVVITELLATCKHLPDFFSSISL